MCVYCGVTYQAEVVTLLVGSAHFIDGVRVCVCVCVHVFACLFVCVLQYCGVTYQFKVFPPNAPFSCFTWGSAHFTDDVCTCIFVCLCVCSCLCMWWIVWGHYTTVGIVVAARGGVSEGILCAITLWIFHSIMYIQARAQYILPLPSYSMGHTLYYVYVSYGQL